MARAVNRSHWAWSVRWPGGICLVSPGIPGKDVGVAGRVNVTACRRLASVRIRCQVHPEVFSAIRVRRRAARW